ncbi:MAG: DNA polymerase III subunit beta [Flavobacteriales bacterium]|nr:DNA polymerase III subunit beta [Flavobacteriales bacterium]
MKFIVNTSTLLEKLQMVMGTITSKPLLPILDHFLFDIQNGQLMISSTDLETSMSTGLSVEADGNLKIAVPSRLTMDTLKSLPAQPVTFNIDTKTNGIEIRSEFGRYKLAGQPGSDFPKLPELDAEQSITMSQGVLLGSISKTIFATGNDDLRLSLTGVYVQLTEDDATFVATDANRLVRCIRKDIKPGIEQNFILPKKALNLLKSSLKDTDDVVRLDFNSSNAFFSYGDIQLICRFIDERYPDYNAVIPEDNPNKLVISREEFLQSVRRINIFSNKSTHQIRLKISGSEMSISAEDYDMSNEATERLSCEYTGEDIEIGFNARLLIEMLSGMYSDQVQFELSTPNRAGIMVPTENEENEDLLMLIMPMMLNAN